MGQAKTQDITHIMASQLQLTTQRLILREVTDQDVDTICAYCAHPEVRRRLLPDQQDAAGLRQELMGALAAQQKHPQHYYCFVLLLQQDALPIGRCLLHIYPAHRYGQIGWDLNHSHWGHGYMPEAALRVIEFAFKTTDVDLIVADCASTNRASIRIMEKVGMTRQRLNLITTWRLARSYQQWQPVVRYLISRPTSVEQVGIHAEME